MNGQKQVTFTTSILTVLTVILIGFIINKIDIVKFINTLPEWSVLNKIILGIIASAILFIILKIGIYFSKIFISAKFAVTLLIAIAIFTIFGTLIIQDESYDKYVNIYGKNIAGWILRLQLDNIFHSYYFGIMLFILAVSLTLVTIKRKPFKLTQIGFTLTHVGTIAILIGGFIGTIWGEKGYLHLIKGKPSDTMKILHKGKETNIEKKLLFTVYLDDFKVEHYDEGDKIAVYEKEKEGYRYLFSINPIKVKEFQLPGGIRTIRILNKNVYVLNEEKTEDNPKDIQAHGHGEIQTRQTSVGTTNLDILIPYFEIEVEKPPFAKSVQNSNQDKSDSQHHGMKIGAFSGAVQLILALGNPLFFENNKYGVVFEQKKEPKLYQSILSIYENNQKKITSPVLVNSPITYKGYKFYQSNYNPENPDYSGILVVKDPGLTLVYIGFILICIGVIYIFYIKPKILEKQRKNNSLTKAYVNSLIT